MWAIWKSRNDFLFSGRRWDPVDIQERAKLDADEWFLAQVVEEEVSKEGMKVERQIKRRWKPPTQGWLMCNIAFEWIESSKLLGVAWVVRNHIGVVLMHSRRAFSNISSLEKARFETIFWTIESMTSLHFNKIVFSGDFKIIFGGTKTSSMAIAWISCGGIVKKA